MLKATICKLILRTTLVLSLFFGFAYPTHSAHQSNFKEQLIAPIASKKKIVSLAAWITAKPETTPTFLLPAVQWIDAKLAVLYLHNKKECVGFTNFGFTLFLRHAPRSSDDLSVVITA